MNEQTATIGSGPGNTIIQIAGNGNAVSLQSAFLHLTRHTQRAPSRAATSQLQQLIPYSRSTTLVGRALELADLRRFAASPDPISVRVLTGGGGTGKTRLALDFCDELAAQGWDSGFVGSGDAGGQAGELQRFAQSPHLSTWGWRKPTFIVVDYAASHVSALATWVAELARRDPPDTRDPTQPAHPLRVLLLERHGQASSGWVADVFGYGAFNDYPKLGLLNPREPVRVAPLSSAVHRAELMNEVLVANAPADKAVLHVDEVLIEKFVSATSWGGDPLFLMMAALYAIEVGHTEALALPRADLARALAQREAARLSKLASAHQPAVPAELAQHLAACVTLAGGMSRADFMAFARTEKLAIGHDTSCDPATLANLLADALPAAQQGTLSPILPDLIGEAFIAIGCHDKGAADIQRWRSALGLPVLQNLLRCGQDFAIHDHDFPPPQLTEWCHGIRDDAEALREFDQLIPMDSVALRALNLRVAEYCSEAAPSDATGNPARRAHQRSVLALALANMGEREKALTAAQEAVTLYRALAAQRPDAFAQDLATSFAVLGVRLAEALQAQEAIAAFAEAVQTLTPMFVRYPVAIAPLMTQTLREYIRLCEDAGAEPDRVLLPPVLAVFDQLNSAHPDQGATE